MHPFYGPNAGLVSEPGSRTAGLASMAAYLAFWAVALIVAMRELDARFPRGSRPPEPTDGALAILRERFARGELDEPRFRAMARVLGEDRGA